MSKTLPHAPAVSSSDAPAASLGLPAILHFSRRQDLEQILSAAQHSSSTVLNASRVEAIDSDGLQNLIDGVRELREAGVVIQIGSPSPTLDGARLALRLQEELPVDPAEQIQTGSEHLGQPIGGILVALQRLSGEDLEKGLLESENQPGRFLGQILIELGFLNEEDLAEGLALQQGLPWLRPVEQRLLDVTLEHGVSLSDLRNHQVLPLLRAHGRMAVAVADPSDVYAVDLFRQATGMQVMVSVASPGEIQRGLDLCQKAAGQGTQNSTSKGGDAEDRLNQVLQQAMIEGASDVHVEPCESDYLLRFRVDGRLHEAMRLANQDGRELTARIKVLAGCDISEKRLPQDGRIHFQEDGRNVDLRVNTMPTVYGEKAVMRVQDRNARAVALTDLGLEGKELEWLQEGIASPHGLVLVTGPTGSGKTTTLYSVLDELVGPELNVSTVENPVERAIAGANQTQVNQKAGLTFSRCLHSLLRQDPDVIMIGEIRDKETAEIAVEAALTGHLVLATLHTNDATGAATRLIQMGVQPFLVAATLRTVLAQRLVRKLCEACKRPVSHPQAVVEQFTDSGLGPGPHFGSTGCAACRKTGYDGRQGLFEVMRVDSKIAELIARNPTSADVRDLALGNGMHSLFDAALMRVKQGQTSLEEALRAGAIS